MELSAAELSAFREFLASIVAPTKVIEVPRPSAPSVRREREGTRSRSGVFRSPLSARFDF